MSFIKPLNKFEDRSLPVILGTKKVKGVTEECSLRLIVFEGKTKIFFVFEELKGKVLFRDSFIGFAKNWLVVKDKTVSFEDRNVVAEIDEAGIHVSTMFMLRKCIRGISSRLAICTI